MHLVLGLIDRWAALDRTPESQWSALAQAITGVVPGGLATSQLHWWVSRDGATLVACWGREGQRLGHDIETTTEATTVSTGHWSSRPTSLRHALLEGVGAGNVAIIGAADDGLHVRTSTSGAEPVYLARGRRLTAISNRAMVAAVAAHGGRLEFDIEALPQYVSAGFALSDRTPFQDVETVPRGTSLHLRRRRFGHSLKQDSHKSTRDSFEPRGPEQVADDLADALISAMKPLDTNHGGPIELGLTGGKDSRLLAAALRAADIPFVTQTFGHDSHPDVVVAQAIAAELGVPHTHNRPRVTTADDGDAFIEVDALDRAVNAVLLAEGMVSSYENLGRTNSPYRQQPVLSGVGGELLRGGYAHYATDLSPAGAERHLRQGFLRYLGLMRPHAAEELKSLVQPWLDRARTRV